MLTQPPLTQTLGPWVERSEGSKPATALSDEKELLAALEAALPRRRPSSSTSRPRCCNALPFYWAGYRLEVRYTYRLEGLGSEEALWDGLAGNIRREIRKARKRVEVRDDLGLDRFYAVWAKTFARQGLAVPTRSPRSPGSTPLRGARARAMLFATDDAGRVHAVSYVVWDGSAAYYLLGGGDPSCARAARAACSCGRRSCARGAVTRRLRLRGLDAEAGRALLPGLRRPPDAVPEREPGEPAWARRAHNAEQLGPPQSGLPPVTRPGFTTTSQANPKMDQKARFSLMSPETCTAKRFRRSTPRTR